MPKVYLSTRKQKKLKKYERSNCNSITDDIYAPWNDLVDHDRVPRKVKTNPPQELAKLPYSRGFDRGSKKRTKNTTVSDSSSKKIPSAALPASPSLMERSQNIVTPTAKLDAIRNHAAPNHVPTPSTVSVTPLGLVTRADSQAYITPHGPETHLVPSSRSPSPIPSRRKRKHIAESLSEDTDEGGDEDVEEFQTPPTKQRRNAHEKPHPNQCAEQNRLSRDIVSSSRPCMPKSRTAVVVTPISPQADGPTTWPSSKAAETTPLTSLYNPSNPRRANSPAGAVLSVFDFLSVVTPSTTKEKRAKKGSIKATGAARNDGKRTKNYGRWRRKLDFSNESGDDKGGDENEMRQGRQRYTNPPADDDAIQGRETKDTLARVECSEQSNVNNIRKRLPERKNRGTICYLELEPEDEELMQAHYDIESPTRVGSRTENESGANANTNITLSIPKPRTSRTKPPSTIKRPHNSSSAGQNNHDPSTHTCSRPKQTDKSSDPAIEKPSLSFFDTPLTVTQTNSTPSSVLRHKNSPLPRVPFDSIASLDPIVMSQNQHACASLDIKSRPALPKFTLSQIGKSFVITGAKAAGKKKRAKDDAVETGGELSRVAEVDKNSFEKNRRKAKRSWLQWQWEEPPAKFPRHHDHETMLGTAEAEHALNELRAQVDGTIDNRDRINGSNEKGTPHAHEEDEQTHESDVRIDEPGGSASKRDGKRNKIHVRSTHQQNNQSWCFEKSPFHDGTKLPTPYAVEQSPPQLHRQSSAVSLCSLEVIKCSIEEIDSREGNAGESAWKRDTNGAFSAEEISSQERTAEKASNLRYDADKIVGDEESVLEALRSIKGANEAFSGEEGNVEERDAEEPSDDEIGGAARPLARLPDRPPFSPKILSISSDPFTSSVDSQSQPCFLSQTFDFPPPPGVRYPNRHPELDTSGTPTISITLDKKKESELTLTSLPVPLAPKTTVPKVAQPSSQAIKKRMLLVPLGKNVVPAARVVTTARVTHGLGSGGRKSAKKRTMSNLVEQGFVAIV